MCIRDRSTQSTWENKMKEEEQLHQEHKINLLKEKLEEREKLIEKAKKDQAKAAEERKERFELIKQQVKMNIFFEEQKKLDEYLERKQLKEKKERKNKERTQRKLEQLREKAEARNEAIQRAIEESQKITDERKKNILAKQHIACLLYTSPSPRDLSTSRMPSSA
eukprot:TRINITY_DN23965_c0_g1_i1.p1 TRINITY_DN23965_c0_g1~~TRINITY_DN23965_c0_g1_i1.p1  ORF type:complete len:176 (-),score=68.02 TRINITY_DN23965_c0_g1_i1:138-632(-)